MKLLDFVHPDLIVAEVEATTKAAVLSELADAVATWMRAQGVSPIGGATLAGILAERERLASTAIGEGVAIPHGKLAGIDRMIGCVARARDGVEFDSIDGQPTRVFFVLIAPESSTGLHLKALARISRVCKDPSFRTRLLEAADAAEMFRVVAEEDARY